MREVERRFNEKMTLSPSARHAIHDILPSGSSLAMVHFPFDENTKLDTPEAVYDPTVCDVALRTDVLGLALLLEDVNIVHGHGSAATSHTTEDMDLLKEACRKVARRVKPYL